MDIAEFEADFVDCGRLSEIFGESELAAIGPSVHSLAGRYALKLSVCRLRGIPQDRVAEVQVIEGDTGPSVPGILSSISHDSQVAVALAMAE